MAKHLESGLGRAATFNLQALAPSGRLANRGGKSTFLRQLIVTSYIKNKHSEFTLIDLNSGLEFQLFEHLDRIMVAPSMATAVSRVNNGDFFQRRAPTCSKYCYKRYIE